MYRLLIIIGLLIVLYFLLRSVLREYLSGRDGARKLTGKDQMVQDPVCRMYVPKASAVASDIGGQTYYFCSQDCAQAFARQLSS